VKYPPIQVRRFAESLNANAQIRNLPVDLLEKDIWITYVLRELRSLDNSNYLAFKGGTCLLTLPRLKFVGFSSYSRRLHGSHTARVIGGVNAAPASWLNMP